MEDATEKREKTGEEDYDPEEEVRGRRPPPRLWSNELEYKYKDLKRTGEMMEKRSNKLGAQAIQIAAYYISFMGIILIGISIPSTNLYTHKWIPFLLCLSISIIFGPTFTAIINKWERSCYYYDLNWLELEYMMTSTFMKKEDPMILQPDKFVIYKRFAFMYLTLASLFAFTILIFYACLN